MNHISHSSRWRVAPVLTLGLVLCLTGCEGLLEIDLPGTITQESLDDPTFAEILTNSAIGQVECAYGRFAGGNSAGNEDVFVRADGNMSTILEYQTSVEGGNTCLSDGDDGTNWWDPLQKARFLAEDLYRRLDVLWTDEGIAVGLINWTNREQMLGVAALYAAIPYDIFGEHLCEVTVTISAEEFGELMTPDETLARGESWVTTALGHIQAHIDEQVLAGVDRDDAKAYPYGITDDSEMMAYGLRSRIRWARGDLPGAVADAGFVEDGFVAVITRDAGSEDQRENPLWRMHSTDPSAAGLMADIRGPIDWWVDPGRSTIGPVGGWPLFMGGPEALIPFTGYRDLAIITANGRAVDVFGNAVTLTTNPGATLDDRVDVVACVECLITGDDGFEQRKYNSAGDPIPLVNWMEMRLIEAEGGSDANAILMVNRVRGTLPQVAYNPTGDEVRNMIIEERRRALFLEGRFWSTKIRNTDKLWFPRGLGQELNPEGNDLGGAVRMLMQNFEFNLNTNLSLADRATLCDDDQKPVFNIGG